MPASTTSHSVLVSPLPEACDEVEPMYEGALDLPKTGTVIADVPFGDGAVVVYRQDVGGSVAFHAIECFTGGGAGFTGGGPGETWHGCSPSTTRMPDSRS